MAKAAKKAPAKKKSARVVAKPKAAKMSAKSAAGKKAAKSRPAQSGSASRKPAARKSARPKVDPLNRKLYTALTPMLAVSDVRQMVNFCTQAFGFSVRGIMDSPQGPMHAELRLRDTTLMLSPESREQKTLSAKSIGDTPATLYVTVENVDDIFDKAVAAGGKVLMPVMDMFWGDRCGLIGDPDGNKWMIATHKADPTEDEMMEAMRQQLQPSGQPAEAPASAGSESEY